MMIPEHLFCLVKTSRYEYYQKHHPQAWKKLALSFRQEIYENHLQHQKFLQWFNQAARELGLKIRYSLTENGLASIPPRTNIIVSIGGDGTFLSAAQHAGEIPVLGINSRSEQNPKKGSVGALTTVHQGNMKETLRRLAQGQFTLRQYPRLAASINGKELSLGAVNDIFVGNIKAYKSSDVEVVYHGRKDRFNCSGVLVCSALGSTAWYKSMGGKPFREKKNTFAFIVREPNPDRKPYFRRGILSGKEELTIVSQDEGYCLAFDSKTEIQALRTLDIVRVKLDMEKRLRVISF